MSQAAVSLRGGALQEIYGELLSMNTWQALPTSEPLRLGVVGMIGVYWSERGDSTRRQRDLARFGLRATLV